MAPKNIETTKTTLCALAVAVWMASGCTGTVETGIDEQPSDTGIEQPDVPAEEPDVGWDAPSETADDLGGIGEDVSTDDAGTTDVGMDVGPIGSPGCIDGDGIPEGENTFTLENRNRRFIMRLPNGYSTDRAWPVVLALHGNGGSAAYWDGTSGDRNIRGVLEDDAILIIAEAIEGNWRDYDADPATWPDRIEDELQYFDYILDLANKELCVDEDAIFSMGFSGGGSFSGVLGCRRTDIRAIAAGGSVIYFDENNCVGTPAAWITIGDLEFTEARAAYRDWFRTRASCAETSTATEPDPCVAYDNCGEGTPVHYCQHPGDHVWPDFGSAAMWEFFRQFLDASQ